MRTASPTIDGEPDRAPVQQHHEQQQQRAEPRQPPGPTVPQLPERNSEEGRVRQEERVRPVSTLRAASAPNSAGGTPRSIPAKVASQRRQTTIIMGTLSASQSGRCGRSAGGRAGRWRSRGRRDEGEEQAELGDRVLGTECRRSPDQRQQQHDAQQQHPALPRREAVASAASEGSPPPTPRRRRRREAAP